MLRQRMFGGKAEIGRATGDGPDNIGALALLDVEADVGILAQERTQSLSADVPTGRTYWRADERSP